MFKLIQSQIQEHQDIAQVCLDELQNHIHMACVLTTDTLAHGNKIILFGNGGSASDAQHIATELVVRYKEYRQALSAIALNCDTSVLTAIGNDYSFEEIFSRQVEALAQKGDLCIAFSTSGNSKNVIKALQTGKNMGCRTIAFSGKGGGEVSKYCDLNIIIPSNDTARIQEMHIMIAHIVVDAIDSVMRAEG